jgi:hypothetical protein
MRFLCLPNRTRASERPPNPEVQVEMGKLIDEVKAGVAATEGFTPSPTDVRPLVRREIQRD